MSTYEDTGSGANYGSTAANPRASQPSQKDSNLPQESTGPVASDSLAAESLESGGGFASNEDAATMGVKGSSSTLNNTDTSGATELRPAADASEREAADRQDESSDIKGPGGLKYSEGVGKADFTGVHNRDGYTGGPSADQGSGTTGQYSADKSNLESGTATGQDYATGAINTGSANTDTAPSYAADFRSEGQLKPKGNNLTEGDVPATKTFTGDVGGPHDPGRLAEQSFQKVNAGTAGSGGSRQGELDTGTGQYDILSSERAGDQSSR